MITSLMINGLRGFSKETQIEFAEPNGKCGSGLTFFVGPNNSGKTTVLEGLKAFNSSKDTPPSFSERKRNVKCDGGKVHLQLTTKDGDTVTIYTIDTVKNGGSSTEYKKLNVTDNSWDGPSIYILQSRRYVDYEFGRSGMERDAYIRNQQYNTFNRSHVINEFNARLFEMSNHKEEFDELLKRVLGYDLTWTIEQNDNGNYFIKFTLNGCSHSSEGLGDGIWSIFTICDALYDSKENSTIAIDEPELSLHPALQKRVMQLLLEYSRDRQIIISTHSPYFIDINAVLNGANLYRMVKAADGVIEAYHLTEDSREHLRGLANDLHNIHTLGLDAKEVFFLEDGIILTEGQEDVLMYTKASEQLGLSINGTFFGWGAGGASKIEQIAAILENLGYQKIVAIFDGDKGEENKKFQKRFPTYKAFIIPTDDIRDKKALEKPAKDGMMTENGLLKEDYEKHMLKLISGINGYLNPESKSKPGCQEEEGTNAET